MPLRTVAADATPRNPGASLREQRTAERILAGHLLRRLGFGPNRREMHEVLRLGRAAYTELQLHPERIDDRIGERLFYPKPAPRDDGVFWQRRWLSRMAFSRRQLQEKMTLIWHELFATSIFKVGSYTLMKDQEKLFRRLALGNFRDLLIGITKDNAMLIYLDNSYNNGQASDDDGNRIPPNENYARELLQLFSIGVNRLNMDGTLVLDASGLPIPSYSETDVKEVARALTGWYANYPRSVTPENPIEYVKRGGFFPWLHDADEKTALGRVLPADEYGSSDVIRVVDAIMRHPTTAPFIAKYLIQKLATETPAPAYVARVASVFAASGGDIRATVEAILTDPEFYSAAVVRSQFKTPIEHLVGAIRGLGVTTPSGKSLYYWTLITDHLPYLPPSVFSFYRPGEKSALVTAANVALRDQVIDFLVNGPVNEFNDAEWDASALIQRRRLRYRPARAVDVLAEDLLAAPASPEMRQILIDYIGPEVTEEKLRGAAWLLMCAPEYQVN